MWLNLGVEGRDLSPEKRGVRTRECFMPQSVGWVEGMSSGPRTESSAGQANRMKASFLEGVSAQADTQSQEEANIVGSARTSELLKHQNLPQQIQGPHTFWPIKRSGGETRDQIDESGFWDSKPKRVHQVQIHCTETIGFWPVRNRLKPECGDHQQVWLQITRD